jgi:hypothetical protein
MSRVIQNGRGLSRSERTQEPEKESDSNQDGQ